MYANFKNPLFHKQDVSCLNQLIKESIQGCADNPSQQNLKILSRTLDCLMYSICVPLFIEEIFSTASPGILTQFEMLGIRLNKWPQGESRDEAFNSLKNVTQKIFFQTPKSIQQYVAKSKPPHYDNNQPFNDIDIVRYLGESLPYSEGHFINSFQAFLRVFRVVLLYQEKMRQEGTNIPEHFFFFKVDYVDKNSIQQNKWDKTIQTLLQILSVPQGDPDNQSRILDMLIFFQRDSKILRQMIIEQGSLRVLINKCSDSDITLEVSLRTLLLVRDLCQGDWVTTDLIGRYETEKNLMRLMQRYTANQELTDLISQILELLIKGSELDMENLQNNLKTTYDKLQKYIATKNQDLDPQKATQQIEVLRFYSLMVPYVHLIVQQKFDHLLMDLLQKEHSIYQDKNIKMDQDHFRILVATNMVLQRITLCTDSFGDVEKLKTLIQQTMLGIKNLVNISQSQNINTAGSSIYQNCSLSYFGLLQICLTTEITKIQSQSSGNVIGQVLLEAKLYWEDNQQISKMINNILQVVASSSKDQAEQIVKKLVIKDTIAKISAETSTQNSKQALDKNKEYAKKKQTLEFIASLSDIPQAVAQIVQSQQGVSCIIDVLSQENKFMVALFPECSESEVDERIYLLDLKGREESKNIDQIFMQAEDPEKLKIAFLEKKRLLRSTMEVLRKLLKNEQFAKSAISVHMMREVLTYLRLFSTERETCILALRILNGMADDEQQQSLLQENKAIESIFFALNDHPMDRDVQELAGNVLKKLGAEEIAKSVKEQFQDLRKEFHPQDSQSVIAVTQATIYLANLMSAVPEEETQQVCEENFDLLECISVFLQKGIPRDTLGSLLLLISRLAAQGGEIRSKLRHSDIPQKIVMQALQEKQFSGDRVPSFAVQALSAMVAGGEETLNVLDSLGCEYEQETSQIRLEYLQPMQLLFHQGKNLSNLSLMISRQFIGQANYAGIRGIACSIENDETNLSYESQSTIISLELIEKCSQLIKQLCRYDESFLPHVMEVKTHESCFQLFKELGELHQPIQIKAQAFLRCGALLAELSRSNPAIFVQVCLEDSVMNSLVEVLERIKIDDTSVNNLPQLEQLQGVLGFLKIFLDNKFDKALVSKRKLPQLISRLLKKLFDYYTANIQIAKDNAFLGIILRDVLQIMYLVVLDPILAKECESYIIPTNKFLGSCLMLPPQPEEPQDSEDVFGSGDPFVRIVESCYRLLDHGLTEIKVCHLMGASCGEDETIINVALLQYNNPFLVCKALSIVRRLLLTLDDQNVKVLWSQRMMYVRKNFKDYSKLTIQKYPKVAIIRQQYNEIQAILQIQDRTLYEAARNKAFGLMLNVQEVDTFQQVELKQIASPDKPRIMQQQSIVKDDSETSQQKKRKAAEGDVSMETAKVTTMGDVFDISDVVKSLDRIANALDVLLQKALDYTAMTVVQQQGQNVDWIQALVKIVLRIREYVQDNPTASKVHQIGVTNTLLSFLMMDDLLTSQVNFVIIDCLAYVSGFQEALKSYENKISLYEPYKSYCQYLMSIRDTQTNRCIAPFFVLMKNAVQLDEIQSKIIKTSQVQLLVRILVNSVDNLQAITSGAECLDRYGYSEKIAQVYFEEGAAKIIINQFPKNFHDVSFASAFCLFIGTICRYPPAQTLLSQHKIHSTILESMSKHPNDIELLSNNFYAISGLCFNNKALAQEIIGSNILNWIKDLLVRYQSSPVLIETICSVISNLTFRNDQNKLIIGNAGLVEQLCDVHAYYCSARQQFRSKTLKQILRALGNVCFLLENSTRLVNSQFIPLSIELLGSQFDYKEKGEVVRYTLDVFANLCSHPEPLNRSNVEQLLKYEIIAFILSLLKNNILQGDLVLAGMDCLDGLIQGKEASRIAGESCIIDNILKINSTHDWNEVVVGKCFRLLANLSILKTNIVYFLAERVPSFLAQKIPDLKTVNAKLLTYAYKVLHRIAAASNDKLNKLHKEGFLEAINEILQKKGIYDNHVELVQLINKVSQSEEAIIIVAQKISNNLFKMISECPENASQRENFLKECITYIHHIGLFLLERMSKSSQAMHYVQINPVIFVLQVSLNLASYSDETKVLILKCIINMCESVPDCRELCFKQNLNKDIITLKENNKQPQIQQVLIQYSQQAVEEVQKRDFFHNVIDKNIVVVSLQDQLKKLIQGFPVKLFRSDGSNKKAVIQLTPDLSNLIVKQPNGVSKKKYQIPMDLIQYLDFDHPRNSNKWNDFILKNNIKNIRKEASPEQFFVIMGKGTEINGEMADVESRLEFESCLKSVIIGLKNGALSLK